MTHKQLVTLINYRLQGATTQVTIDRVLAELADVLAEELAQGEIVTIRNIGTLTTLAAPERMGTNPKTGEKILIPAAKRIKLKTCAALKSKVQ
jgi:integration host factor subunit beta